MSRGRGAALALGAGLIAVALAGATLAAGRAPATGRAATLWLAVESRALDGDLAYDDVDRARFRTRFGADAGDVALATRDGRRELDSPALWTASAAFARRGLGPRGPFLLQGMLFALAALAVAETLRSRLGASAAVRLAGAAFAGSAALLAAWTLEPRALEMAATAIAAAAVWRRRSGVKAAADDIYRGEGPRGPGLGRFALAGAALGVVVAGSLSYLPLALPLVAAVPERRPRATRAALLAAAVAVLAAFWMIRGLPGPWPDLALDPRLWAWSAVGALAGRGVGLLPYFLPAALLATASGRDGGRRWVLPAIALALVAQLAAAPFDFTGSAGGFGNAWFLAPLALLAAAAGHDDGGRWTLAAVVVGAPFLAAPVWLEPLDAGAVSARAARLAAPVVGLLPEPTTLRVAPGAAQVDRAGLVARGIGPAIDAGTGGALRLRVRRGELFVISDRPLASLRLELGAAAPVALEVRGGKLGNVTIRPSGDLAVDVGLDPRRARRHAVWWSREGAWIHRLEIRLPTAPTRPIPLDVAFGRPVVPEGSRET